MKAFLTATAALVLAAAHSAHAQTPSNAPLMRGDIIGTVGMIQVNHQELQSYNRWHGDAYFGIDVGWYWTEHLKTSIEVATTTESTVYSSGPVVFDGRVTSGSSRHEVGSSRVSLSQRYQFGHNQWFHPHLGGGIEIVRETRSSIDEPIFFYDQVTRQSRVLREGRPRVDDAEVRALGQLSTGFKGYLSRKVFFLADLRVMFTSRPEEVLTRVGVGVDF